VTRGAALGGALLVTLATPATWPLALGAFLIRGGIMLVALPLVVLPTPVGLGNVLGPTLTSMAFGSVSTEVLIVLGLTVVGALTWLVIGGWLAVVLEMEAIRIVALDEDVAAHDEDAAAPGRTSASPATGRTAARVLVARLIANIPLGLVLAWGLIRLVIVTYDELTSPLDVSMPIVVRVLRGAPEVVVGIGLAWMVGQIVGAVAARRIVLAGDGVGRALRFALHTSIRHPLSALGSFWIPTLGLIVVLVPSALAAAAAAGAVRSVLRQPDDPIAILVAVLSLVLLWVVGLVLAAVVCAWRSAVWTVAAIARDRTFGGSTDRRPGDWRRDRSSGTL